MSRTRPSPLPAPSRRVWPAPSRRTQPWSDLPAPSRWPGSKRPRPLRRSGGRGAYRGQRGDAQRHARALRHVMITLGRLLRARVKSCGAARRDGPKGGAPDVAPFFWSNAPDCVLACLRVAQLVVSGSSEAVAFRVFDAGSGPSEHNTLRAAFFPASRFGLYCSTEALDARGSSLRNTRTAVRRKNLAFLPRVLATGRLARFFLFTVVQCSGLSLSSLVQAPMACVEQQQGSRLPR